MDIWEESVYGLSVSSSAASLFHFLRVIIALWLWKQKSSALEYFGAKHRIIDVFKRCRRVQGKEREKADVMEFFCF